MKFEVKVLGTYDNINAINERDAKEQALHHFHTALNRWANKKDSAAHIFYIEIKEVGKK